MRWGWEGPRRMKVFTVARRKTRNRQRFTFHTHPLGADSIGAYHGDHLRPASGRCCKLGMLRRAF